MDVRLNQIATKAAGTYFIVSDLSAVPVIEEESKMRLFFINSEFGQTNTLFKFAKGDTASFITMFGNTTRSAHKKGNFGIQTCLDALIGGPIAVVNLRAYDSLLDETTVNGMNPNIQDPETVTTEYTNLFNQNGFWSAKPKNMNDVLAETHLLNFGSVGSSDVSIFVRKAEDVTLLTSEGDKTLESSQLDIEDFPGLNFDSLVKDNFVDVYVFANVFDATSDTNQYYGQYFDSNGYVDVANLEALSQIPEAGFIRKHIGSLIPGLKSELDQEISIDTIMYQYYATDGIICDIDEDALEVEANVIDFEGVDFHDASGLKVPATSDYLVSHVVPEQLTFDATVWPLTDIAENVPPTNANLITYTCEKEDDKSFIGSFEQGLRIDDIIAGVDGNVYITSVEILNEAEPIGITGDTYTKVKYTCNANIDFQALDTEITKKNFFVNSSLVAPTNLISYKPRADQFLNGSASRQNEILDMMNSPSITKGIKTTKGIRYLVDGFKSFVEPGYKYQYGVLSKSLESANKFVRNIINEPFIEDLEKSTNPLFADYPGGQFDMSYLPIGGNKAYSTILLNKFSTGESNSFFFGPGNKINNVIFPLAGLISNLFYEKTIPFDILANETGYVDGITEIEYAIDDEERKYCEDFRFNPIIDIDGGLTIFGNLSGQLKVTKQQQLHNSELLAYIQESLTNLAKGDAFKKATYDNYLKTETEVKSFMDSLVLGAAIEPDPVVICSAENNTEEIANNKIKLVHIEYYPLNSLEKIVFDLNIL